MAKTAWTERDERPGWDITYTNVGGRWRSWDPYSRMQAANRNHVARFNSQAFIAATTSKFEPNSEILYWATLCIKALQRGLNPPIDPAIDKILCREGLQPLPEGTTAGPLLQSALDDAAVWELEPTIELHIGMEKPFWKSLSDKEPSLLRWVTPQAPLEALSLIDDSENHHWVDFYFAHPGASPCVVELDGKEHHPEKSAVTDSARDSLLSRGKLDVFRLSWTDLNSNLGIDKLRTSLSVGSETASAIDRDGLREVLFAPTTVHRVCFGIVEGVVRGFLKAGEPWFIEINDSIGITNDVAGMVLDHIAAFDDLWGTGIVPDEISINGELWSRTDGNFLRTGLRTESDEVNLRISIDVDRPPHATLPDSEFPQIVIRHAFLGVDLPWIRSRSSERRNLTSGSSAVDGALRTLARSLFGHSEFREGQSEAIKLVLGGHDSLVMLPTGSGKSLVYQLSMLLRPGAAIVVDPIVALIDDQTLRLRQEGIERVAGMHAAVLADRKKRERMFADLSGGETYVVLISPERLQIESFRTALSAAASDHLINLIVVDEAHCVSEWGHDFRPAYLRLGRNLRRFTSGFDDVPPPMLGLTGTASPAVLRDVQRELSESGLPNDGALNLIKPLSFDRENLRYSIEGVDEGSQQSALLQLLQHEVPEALKIDSSEISNSNGRETQSGIIFVPHRTGKLGAIDVAKVLRNQLGAESVGFYFGTKPKKWDSPIAFDEFKRKSASDFIENRVPMLIATNAFGMGIDKPNIRYTVHLGFPRSIESFAQEAGRAGRDRKQSLCFLLTSLPSQGVASRLLDVVTDRSERLNFFELQRKRYDSNDLVRQLYFHYQSFPQLEDEFNLADLVMDEIVARGFLAGREVVEFDGSTLAASEAVKDEKKPIPRKKEFEKVLYRLGVLGIVDDYTWAPIGRDSDDSEALRVVFTVYRGDLEESALRNKLLLFAQRVDPGRRRSYERKIAEVEGTQVERIKQFLRMVVEITFRVIEPARLRALEEMYRLAIAGDSDEAIRGRINAYLGAGPLASILPSLIADAEVIETRKVISALETVPPLDEFEWAGASARQLEESPDHPIALIASALAQAWLPEGDPELFLTRTSQAFSGLTEYGVGDADGFHLFRWVLVQLGSQQDGRRSEWRALAWIAAGQHWLHVDDSLGLEDKMMSSSRTTALEKDAIRNRKQIRNAQDARGLVSTQILESDDGYE